ncbi:MAG: MBL fold metallo-hydrolase [Phycisphaera sp.]|nr:MBL fold metallo-hydrolase [Phycisphaera sp.]
MHYRIISIGALSAHELWGEKQPVRRAHATTTLIHADDKTILVDPGLPAQAIAALLKERTGKGPEQVTDVFLTNFRPAHRAGLAAFDHANWFICETERETIGQALIESFRTQDEPEYREALEQDINILKRCKPSPDKLADQVDLFPLPGFTPGTCGLLLLHAGSTTLIAGDAVPTVEHMEQGRVLRGCADTEQARESLVEALEIADAIIPGHDNIVVNPSRRSV